MAVTVSGTSITFNDATVQTTAAGAPTTAQVLNATAGAALGAVGTYAFLSRVAYSNTPNVAGTTYAGSVLRYAGGLSFTGTGAYISIGSVTPSGTWRAMGLAGNVNNGCVASEFGTLFLRIS